MVAYGCFGGFDGAFSGIRGNSSVCCRFGLCNLREKGSGDIVGFVGTSSCDFCGHVVSVLDVVELLLCGQSICYWQLRMDGARCVLDFLGVLSSASAFCGEGILER